MNGVQSPGPGPWPPGAMSRGSPSRTWCHHELGSIVKRAPSRERKNIVTLQSFKMVPKPDDEYVQLPRAALCDCDGSLSVETTRKQFWCDRGSTAFVRVLLGIASTSVWPRTDFCVASSRRERARERRKPLVLPTLGDLSHSWLSPIPRSFPAMIICSRWC